MQETRTMKIGNSIENLTQAASGSAASGPKTVNEVLTTPSESNSGGLADSAKVSATGGQALLSTASTEVRLDKVANIQNALAAGNYTVPASAVAAKLVDAMLTTKQ